MTSNDFRRLALGLPDATEQSHMNHPDFRVGGKIFATLGYPNTDWGMVKLTPFDQDLFVQADPEAFAPVKGKWGEQGATSVRLSKAKKTLLLKALAIAHKDALGHSASRGRSLRSRRRT